MERGAGVEQPALRFAASRLGRGDWVQLFPQGRCVPETGHGELAPLRRGFAQMLCDCAERPPVVLPFWHSGMELVKPIGTWAPRPWPYVHVTVGEPLDFADLLPRCRACEKDAAARDALHHDITSRLHAALAELRRRNLEERAAAGHPWPS